MVHMEIFLSETSKKTTYFTILAVFRGLPGSNACRCGRKKLVVEVGWEKGKRGCSFMAPRCAVEVSVGGQSCLNNPGTRRSTRVEKREALEPEKRTNYGIINPSCKICRRGGELAFVDQGRGKQRAGQLRNCQQGGQPASGQRLISLC